MMTETDLWDELVDLEEHFGGIQKGVPRRKVSPLDPRSPEVVAAGGMQGGDRMGAPHRYGRHYARELLPLVGAPGLTIVEVGILRGTGLAVWSRMFPQARLIGMDVDLSHFRENREALEGLGAFTRGVEICEVDQFSVTTEDIMGSIGPAGVNMVIDDGFHSIETALRTFEAFCPMLAPPWRYFIEDIDGMAEALASTFMSGFADLDIRSYGRLTAVRSWS